MWGEQEDKTKCAAASNGDAQRVEPRGQGYYSSLCVRLCLCVAGADAAMFIGERNVRTGAPSFELSTDALQVASHTPAIGSTRAPCATTQR